MSSALERLRQPFRKRTAEKQMAQKCSWAHNKTSLMSLESSEQYPHTNITGFHKHQIMSSLYILLSLLWAFGIAFCASDSIDATAHATPTLNVAAATALTTSSKPSSSISTRRFDDASLSRAKESYQSSFYTSLYGSGTTASTTAYSTPLAVCTSLASVDQRICTQAVRRYRAVLMYIFQQNDWVLRRKHPITVSVSVTMVLEKLLRAHYWSP
ncbi:hypothetical protein DL98DRAFT_527579 [Cadophora sp. DSE1049]|nr:hypothetical protein DL98DRAFT_527579 [Cadophora sp. DSE1049]